MQIVKELGRFKFILRTKVGPLRWTMFLIGYKTKKYRDWRKCLEEEKRKKGVVIQNEEDEMQTFVVVGQMGTHSDKLWWFVDSWEIEDQAEDRVEELTNMAKSLGYRDTMSWYDFDVLIETLKSIERGDPGIISISKISALALEYSVRPIRKGTPLNDNKRP